MLRTRLKTWFLIVNIAGCLCLLSSCEKFLDKKSEQSVLIPSSLKDLQAILDNNITLNFYTTPGLLEIAADDYFLEESVYNNLPAFDRQSFIWDPNPDYLQTNINGQWKNPFLVIFTANTVLERLRQIGANEFNKNEYNLVKGMALFLRGFTYYQLTQVYCSDYRMGDVEHNRNSLGLPLRLTSDFEEKSVRSTLQETYDQIISDLTLSASLLPNSVPIATRPSKAAAHAALARTFLVMADYDAALMHAQKSLDLNDTLMDYQDISTTSTVPFDALNPETLFYSYNGSAPVLRPDRANVDTLLYDLYEDDDLRKVIFFDPKANGYHAFKGNYAGYYDGTFFSGLAVDEQYLIKAECLARKGNVEKAKKTLSLLLEKRYENGFVFPADITAGDELLAYILTERRKELIQRGVRWSDIKRLNRDDRFAKTLTRKIFGENGAHTFSLPVNDLRYIMLLPQEVIRITGMVQNPR